MRPNLTHLDAYPSEWPLSTEHDLTRTRTTHPLRIDEMELANGHVGLAFCPGKQGDSIFGASWARNMLIDLDAVAAWGAAVVVTLIEEHEFDLLGVRGLGEAVKARGIDWLHFPIRDLDVPTSETGLLWRRLSARIHDRLERGGKMLIHCRGGVGRAGRLARDPLAADMLSEFYPGG